MGWVEACWIAIVQGATELFPVSSLGHAVVLPALLRSALDQASPAFLPFVVLLHAGTAVALLAFFWRDWLALGLGVIGASERQRVVESRRILLLIVVATIPAGLAGLLLERFVRGLFASPLVAAGFLVANGVMLLGGQRLRARAAAGGHRPIATLSMLDALVIGLWQCLALIPGISRSGATMIAGLTRGINYEASAHFSFLIALPIIAGATLHQVPKLLHASIPPGTFEIAAGAAVLSGAVAWLSTWFLMRYFRSHDEWALSPFGYYCIAFGLGSLAILALR